MHDTTALEESVIASVRGTVLVIGESAGANFDDLPEDITWIGLEADQLPTLRKRPRRFSCDSKVIEGVAERIMTPISS